MSDQLLMWHNAAYSVYFTQRQVPVSGMREHIVEGVHILIKSVYKHYTDTDMKVTELT